MKKYNTNYLLKNCTYAAPITHNIRLEGPKTYAINDLDEKKKVFFKRNLQNCPDTFLFPASRFPQGCIEYYRIPLSRLQGLQFDDSRNFPGFIIVVQTVQITYERHGYRFSDNYCISRRRKLPSFPAGSAPVYTDNMHTG